MCGSPMPGIETRSSLSSPSSEKTSESGRKREGKGKLVCCCVLIALDLVPSLFYPAG